MTYSHRRHQRWKLCPPHGKTLTSPKQVHYILFSCNVNFISGYVLNVLDWFVIKQLLCVETKTR
jgi:hypothetical protein